MTTTSVIARSPAGGSGLSVTIKSVADTLPENGRKLIAPADLTPGIDSNRLVKSLKKPTVRSFAPYFDRGSDMLIVNTQSGLIPGFVACSRIKLLIINPEQISRTSATA